MWYADHSYRRISVENISPVSPVIGELGSHNAAHNSCWNSSYNSAGLKLLRALHHLPPQVTKPIQRHLAGKKIKKIRKIPRRRGGGAEVLCDLAGLGIRSSDFLANRSFFAQKLANEQFTHSHIFDERPERFAHDRSFPLSDLSESLMVAHHF